MGKTPVPTGFSCQPILHADENADSALRRSDAQRKADALQPLSVSAGTGPVIPVLLLLVGGKDDIVETFAALLDSCPGSFAILMHVKLHHIFDLSRANHPILTQPFIFEA